MSPGTSNSLSRPRAPIFPTRLAPIWLNQMSPSAARTTCSGFASPFSDGNSAIAPSGVIAAIRRLPYSAIQSTPPLLASPIGCAPPSRAKLEIEPLWSIRPTRSASGSVHQIAPSGPTATAAGAAPSGRGNSSTRPLRSTRPIADPPVSANQRARSGPEMIPPITLLRRAGNRFQDLSVSSRRTDHVGNFRRVVPCGEPDLAVRRKGKRLGASPLREFNRISFFGCGGRRHDRQQDEQRRQRDVKLAQTRLASSMSDPHLGDQLLDARGSALAAQAGDEGDAQGRVRRGRRHGRSGRSRSGRPRPLSKVGRTPTLTAAGTPSAKAA